jgi:hypothetical protein
MIYRAFRDGLLISLGMLFLSASTYAQPSKEDSLLCYKSAIREPITFYGNPLDTSLCMTAVSGG